MYIPAFNLINYSLEGDIYLIVYFSYLISDIIYIVIKCITLIASSFVFAI